MILWMLAKEDVWNTLVHKKVLYVNPELMDSDPIFERPYFWMREQLQCRITGYGDHFPWWSFARYRDEKIKPDLRSRSETHWFVAGTPAVRIELDIPDHEVLLSDADLWTAVLNDWYLPPLNTRAELSGERWYRADRRGTCPPDRLRRIKERSWERVFDIPQERVWDDYLGWRGSAVQACYETLRLENVRQVTRFTSRPPKRR